MRMEMPVYIRKGWSGSVGEGVGGQVTRDVVGECECEYEWVRRTIKKRQHEMTPTPNYNTHQSRTDQKPGCPPCKIGHQNPQQGIDRHVPQQQSTQQQIALPPDRQNDPGRLGQLLVVPPHHDLQLYRIQPHHGEGQAGEEGGE